MTPLNSSASFDIPRSTAFYKPETSQDAPPTKLLEKPLASKGKIDPAIAESISTQLADLRSSDEVIAKIVYIAVNFNTLPELNGLLKRNPDFSERINQQVIDILAQRGVDVQINNDGSLQVNSDISHTETGDDHHLYATPRKTSSVKGRHVEVTNRAMVVLTNGATADAYHGGQVSAVGSNISANICYGGYGSFTSGSSGEISDGGKAHAMTAATINLRDGSSGVVSNGGIGLAHHGSHIDIHDAGIAHLYEGSIGKMTGKGNATVHQGANLAASNGTVTVDDNGFAHATDNAKLVVLAGGEGVVEKFSAATVREHGHVTVGRNGSAIVENGASALIKNGGSARADKSARIKVEPGARVLFHDPRTVVQCGSAMKKVSDLKNFIGGRRDYIEITDADFPDKLSTSILKKGMAPGSKMSTPKSVHFDPALGEIGNDEITPVSSTKTDRPTAASGKPILTAKPGALRNKLADLVHNGLSRPPVRTTRTLQPDSSTVPENPMLKGTAEPAKK